MSGVIWMPKHKASQLQISDHARQRWLERGGQGNLTPTWVTKRLREALPLGSPVVEEAVRVPLDETRDAVCVPNTGAEGGGWTCVTVIYRQKESA
jgi:hypothetical protein